MFGKVFGKIIFNRLYNFLLDEGLLNPNQSGLCSTNSCVNQSRTITLEIFDAFDCNLSLEAKSVFLDISKAFDKVRHQGSLYELKSMGFSGELYDLLYGQTSSWESVLARVFHVSIFGPLFSLIDINDLRNELKTNGKLFAKDTYLFTIIKDINGIINALNNYLCLISKSASTKKMLFNSDTSKPAQEVLLSKKESSNSSPLYVSIISSEKSVKSKTPWKLINESRISSNMFTVL